MTPVVATSKRFCIEQAAEWINDAITMDDPAAQQEAFAFVAAYTALAAVLTAEPDSIAIDAWKESADHWQAEAEFARTEIGELKQVIHDLINTELRAPWATQPLGDHSDPAGRTATARGTNRPRHLREESA